jgi:hypothetical protein
MNRIAATRRCSRVAAPGVFRVSVSEVAGGRSNTQSGVFLLADTEILHMVADGQSFGRDTWDDIEADLR